MLTSLLKTLACKHRSTVRKTAARYWAQVKIRHGPRTCYQASVERTGRTPLTATFGGIPLRHNQDAVLPDRAPTPITTRHKELIGRLRAGRCELCKNTGPVQVHQVAKLAQLHTPGRSQPAWAELMMKRRRKTLIVCAACHTMIHARHPTATPTH